MTLALPVIWFAGLAILVAALRMENDAAAARRPAAVPVLEVRRAATGTA